MKTSAAVLVGILLLGVAPAHADDRHVVSLSTGAAVSGGTKISFYVGLKRPEAKARKAYRAVSNPTSDDYRRFLPRRKVAKKYGASKATIRKARRSVGKYGLKLQPDDTRVFARVYGTARQMKNWTGRAVRREVEVVPGGKITFYYTRTAWPKQRTPGVSEYFFLDVRSRYSRKAAKLSSANPAYDGQRSGTPLDSCLPGDFAKVNKYTYSVNQLRTAYGIDALPTDVGPQTRVAIVAQGGGFSDNAMTAFAGCFGLPQATFDRVSVPGLRGKLPLDPEGDLDTQVVSSVLPAGSRVSVVETSGYDWRDFLTWSTVFGLDHLPDVATTSYGMCEPRQVEYVGLWGLTMTESVLLRLGLAGTAVFASTGDSGSSGCVNQNTGTGSRQRAVSYPSSSPYVTAVGGTRIALDAANQRVEEVVWSGQALDSSDMPAEDVAGAGGRSELFRVPWWQKRVSATSRTVPDVSAHASGLPGWPLITTGDAGQLIVGPSGGTSASAPFVAAGFGVIAAGERAAGRPALGPVQPWLYRLARTSPDALYDVTVGNNDVFGKGCCSARNGYDRASGLGAVRFDRIAQSVPSPG